MVKNKAGISAIVATVLIILITVAAITIIWTAIIPMISESAAFDDPDARLEITTRGGYTFYDSEQKVLYVQVKRGADETDMIGVEILVMIGGKTTPFTEDKNGNLFAAPAVNGLKVYELNLSTIIEDGQVPDSVSVIPIFDGDGGTTAGPASASVPTPSGISSTPSSNPSNPDTGNDGNGGGAVCDFSHLDLCTGLTVCEGASGFWYDNDCNADEQVCDDMDGDEFDDCELGTSGDDGEEIDCDDGANDVYPGALEKCDGKDNDCDNVMDGARAAEEFLYEGDAWCVETSSIGPLCVVKGTGVWCNECRDHTDCSLGEICESGGICAYSS